MQGCLTASFPLWKLGYVLNEAHLEEDLANSLLEILYFRGRQSQIKASLGDVNTVPPTFLFPTEFFNAAQLLYTSAKPRQAPVYSQELLRIQCRLRNCQNEISSILHVGFLVVRNNHYVAYFHRGGGSSVEYTDSLGHDPDPQELRIIQWALGDVLHIPSKVVKAVVERQPTFGQGSGSCAFAAHNFLERQVFRDTVKWQHGLSDEFRDRALQQLVLYNAINSFSNLVRESYFLLTPEFAQVLKIICYIYRQLICMLQRETKAAMELQKMKTRR